MRNPTQYNTKETLAIYYALQSFKGNLVIHHILLKSDNILCLSVSNMDGMSSELHDKIGFDTWSIVVGMNSRLSIAFIPRKDILMQTLQVGSYLSTQNGYCRLIFFNA